VPLALSHAFEALVASIFIVRYDPLKIYVNDEGLVRFATELYSDSVDTLQSRTELSSALCDLEKKLEAE